MAASSAGKAEGRANRSYPDMKMSGRDGWQGTSSDAPHEPRTVFGVVVRFGIFDVGRVRHGSHRG